MVIRVITCDNDMHPFRRVVRELKLAEAKGILISMAEFVYQMYKARKAHGDKVILDDVTLSFYPGAKIGVVGPNGMGKSTLLKVMAGLEEVSAGDARLTPGYTVGILQQEPPLDEDKTVLENVQMAFADIIAKVERFNKIGEEMGSPTLISTPSWTRWASCKTRSTRRTAGTWTASSPRRWTRCSARIPTCP